MPHIVVSADADGRYQVVVDGQSPLIIEFPFSADEVLRALAVDTVIPAAVTNLLWPTVQVDPATPTNDLPGHAPHTGAEGPRKGCNGWEARTYAAADIGTN